MHELLRDYVLILANTGMRHGTEAQNLRWKYVSIIEQNGRSYVAIWVKGKTKERELIARRSGLSDLKRIHRKAAFTAPLLYFRDIRMLETPRRVTHDPTVCNDRRIRRQSRKP
jgi:hypothetical protein